MFTGIVKAIGKIHALEKEGSILRYAVCFPPEMLLALELGASVSIDGVCQTVVSIRSPLVWFEAIEETVLKTTFSEMVIDQRVNLERSAKIGDEIGGHLLSGHVYGTAEIFNIKENIYTFSCSKNWMKYLFSKGYIAIDGISLTLVEVDRQQGHFSVHLIPETLKRTTLGEKKAGKRVNLEFDSLTQAAVETLENLVAMQKLVSFRT